MAGDFLLILVAILLVLLNAFFVAAEFGMVKLRHTRISVVKRSYGMRGVILGQIHKQLDAYLSACQLGITLASIGLGWVGEPAFAQLLEPLFKLAGIESHDVRTVLAFFVAFSIISFLHIVIGELVPKSLAIRQSERVSVWTAIPLYIFYWLMYPAIWLLNSCANAILKIARLDVINKDETTYSPEEIKQIVNTSHIHTQLSKQELDILKHTLELRELDVTDVMRPIEYMISMEADLNIDEALDIALQHRYSRYPIYYKETREIVGIVHVKDLLQALKQNDTPQDLKAIMRPILKVSRRLSVISLLNKLQEGMPHFAVVYSGRDKAVGFVTLDNIIQVLLGRVRDEFHNIDEQWIANANGSFLMKGDNTTYSLERALNIELTPTDENDEIADTIFELVLTKLGHLPKEGEKVEFEQFTIIVTKLKGHKISQVLVYPKHKADDDTTHAE